jgi:hypothetical protein
MNNTPPPQSHLDAIDARQDDVLRQLEELNVRVEGLIKEWTAARHAGEEVETTANPQADAAPATNPLKPR